jgi:hypothetical protein
MESGRHLSPALIATIDEWSRRRSSSISNLLGSSVPKQRFERCAVGAICINDGAGRGSWANLKKSKSDIAHIKRPSALILATDQRRPDSSPLETAAHKAAVTRRASVKENVCVVFTNAGVEPLILEAKEAANFGRSGAMHPLGTVMAIRRR